MTTATTWRKERGRETERLLAAYWRERGWPYAEPVGAGRQGADITGMPGLAVEVKATRACQPMAWLRQANGRGVLEEGLSVLPLVVWRPDGMGEAHLREWPALTNVLFMTRLLRAAGYGDGED